MKSKISILFVLCSFFVSLSVRGQLSPYIHPVTASYFASACGTEQRMRDFRLDPTFREREKRVNSAILQATSLERPDFFVSYTLPVVFHIVGTTPTAITDAQILAALADLNNAFAHTGAYASGPGANTQISFCLAKKDPQGGNTTGITRTTSYLTNMDPDMEDDKLKGLVDWDPTRYINIWVVSGINREDLAIFQCGSWSRMNEGGYATMPSGAGGPLDGIVVTGFGILLAHEMGHYLGLYHTFQGMDCKNNDCSTDGDMVCDTPPQRDVFSSPSCSSPVNSCSTDTLSGFTTDVPDLISNFMSYGNASCINEFTPGQAARMQATIATVRSSLLAGECSAPCGESSSALFTRDLPYPLPGNTVNFTNASTGATQYQWSVNGTVVSSATNFSYTFPASGKYAINLRAYNASISCYSDYSDNVIVSCGTAARFYPDKTTIASKAGLYLDSIQFTNRSVNGTSYQWLLSNGAGMTDSVVGTSPNLTYVFGIPGNYTMQLIATNGTCVDTSEPFSIPVLDPTPDGVLTLQDVHWYHQDSIQLSVVVCNEGYAPFPKGVPITFYDADPTGGAAHKIGQSFTLPDTVLGKCCNASYSVLLAAGEQGLNQLYAVLNDSGTTMPLALPNTSFLESNYLNNESITAGFQFSLSITPPDTTVMRKQAYQLKLSGSNPETYTAEWSPGSGYALSCLACDSTNVQVFENGMVHVQATTQYGCIATDSVLVKILPPDLTVTVDKTECYTNDSLLVHFTVCMNNGYDSVWAGIPVSFYDSVGAVGPFFVTPTLTSASCSSYTQVIKMPVSQHLTALVNAKDSVPETLYTNNGDTVAVTPLTLVITPSDTSTPTGTLLPLAALVNGGTASGVAWSPSTDLSCADCLEPLLTAAYTQQYRVIVRNQYSCIDTAFALIKTYTGGEVNIPSAFTPNGDGRNDVFYVMGGKDVQTVVHLAIFSRYGSTVFESSNALPNDPSLGWNGTHHGQPAEPGAYVYMAQIRFSDGRLANYKGTLVLIR